MIPKRIFFYWENNRMSWMRYMTLYSFRKLHPDWQMDLYYDDKPISFHAPYLKGINTDKANKESKQDFHNYTSTLDYSENLEKLNINIIKWDTDEVNLSKFTDITPSGKSNILKWHQLAKYGGVYADMDILFFKPIDQLFDYWNRENANVVISQSMYLSIGLMASTPHNKFFNDIFQHTFKFATHASYQTYGVMTVYDLYDRKTPKSEVMKKAKIKYPNETFINLPMDVVYHFNHKDIDRCFDTTNGRLGIHLFPSESIGYHWYAGGDAAQKYNNILNHINYPRHNVLFSKLCQRYFPEVKEGNDFFKVNETIFQSAIQPPPEPPPPQRLVPIKTLEPPANAGVEINRVYTTNKKQRRQEKIIQSRR